MGNVGSGDYRDPFSRQWKRSGSGQGWFDPAQSLESMIAQKTTAEQIVMIESYQSIAAGRPPDASWSKILSDRLALARQQLAAEQAAAQRAVQEAARQAAAQRAAQEAARQAAVQRAAEEAARQAAVQLAAQEAARQAAVQLAAEEAARQAAAQVVTEEGLVDDQQQNDNNSLLVLSTQTPLSFFNSPRPDAMRSTSLSHTQSKRHTEACLEHLLKYAFEAITSQDHEILRFNDASVKPLTQLFNWDLLTIMCTHMPRILKWTPSMRQ